MSNKLVKIKLDNQCLSYNNIKEAFKGYDISISDSKITYRGNSFRILFCNNTLRLSKFPTAYSFIREQITNSLIPSGTLTIDMNEMDKCIDEIDYKGRNSKNAISAAKFNLQIFETLLTSKFDEYFKDLFGVQCNLIRSNKFWHHIVPTYYNIKFGSECEFTIQFRHNTEPHYIGNTDSDKLDIMIFASVSFPNEGSYSLSTKPYNLSSDQMTAFFKSTKDLITERIKFEKQKKIYMDDCINKIKRLEMDLITSKEQLVRYRNNLIRTIPWNMSKEEYVSQLIDADLI